MISFILRWIAIFSFSTILEAGIPVWTFTPLTATTVVVAANGTATVEYTVTNQSKRTHILSLQAIEAITQTTTGLGVCGNPFVLTSGGSCTLSLSIDGSKLTTSIDDGPVVCEQGSTLQCYRPGDADILHITQGAAILDATITVTGSPLTLNSNGATGSLTINNTSTLVTATNITSDFTGTALDGNVTESGNTCSSVAPLGSCTLTYTPGSTVVAETDFTIQGSNTNSITAAIEIDQGVELISISPTSGSASGGLGFTLTGLVLTGATSVTFGGVDATSINVVDSTTVTGVTPANAVGSVDVVITTPDGSSTLTDGFTYETTAIGQSAYGGYIGCLNGGLNDLIITTTDNSSGILWGSLNVNVPAAQSTTDGATNTVAIINAVGQPTPNAASICVDYEIDSQGNTPCESGNTCYDGWFLPAGNNTTSTGQLNCIYTNRSSIPGGFSTDYYWSSTQATNTRAYIVNFLNGSQAVPRKNQSRHVRCARAFTP